MNIYIWDEEDERAEAYWADRLERILEAKESQRPVGKDHSE